MWWVLGVVAVLCLASGPARAALAQQAVSQLVSEAALPDAPGRGATGDEFDDKGGPATGSISGTVLDTNGTVIPAANVTLTEKGAGGERATVTGSNGEFSFSGLPSGVFRLSVSSKGMRSYVSPEFSLAAGEIHEVPRIVLPVAVANTDVQVTATQAEVAQEEVNIALHQRLFGVLPNFYSNYNWHAPPLGSKQKFELAFRSVSDPIAFLGYGFAAAVQQASNTFPGYKQGWEGYGKRYGAAFADDSIGRFVGSAILPSLLHQDPRYFQMGKGGFRKRFLYALSAAVICKGDNGRWQPNYSHVGGAFTAGALSNLYHPAGDRGVGLTVFNGFIDTAGNAANNVIREFLFRKLTPKVPDYDQEIQ